MNICFVCSEYPPGPHGGIGSFTQLLGRSLAVRGHNVRVIGAYSGLKTALANEVDAGVEVWRLRRMEPRLGWVGTRLRLFRQVAEWAQDGLIDLVEVPDWEGWIAGWPKLPVPVVTRLHGCSCYFSSELNVPYRRGTFWLEQAALRRADRWCSVSRYTAERTREVFGWKSHDGAVIYNAVDVAGIPSAPRSRSDVVFSGTLTEKKGVHALIAAWPRVIGQHPDARLHFYGKDGLDGSSTPVAQRLLAYLPEAARVTVRFHGHQPRQQLLAHLRTARMAVFPSLAEAFAMAPLEAMAQACPTIYSKRGSGPELIRNGQDGLLINPAEPREIAEAIHRVLEDDALAERLGRAGHARVKSEFALPGIVQINESFYTECVESFRRRIRN